jgi:hypothetical protein
MAEVDLGVKNPKSVQDADWLQEAEKPRLFSKAGTWKWGQRNADGIPAHPSARRPLAELQQEMNVETLKKIKTKYGLEKENESEARAVWHILQEKDTKEVIAGEDKIKQFFGLSTRQQGIKMVDDLKITKDGKLIPIEVKNMGRVDLATESNAALKKFESIANRVDMEKVDHFEIICHSTSTLLDNGYKVDGRGRLLKQLVNTSPPQWKFVEYGGKRVFIKYGDLGEISK